VFDLSDGKILSDGTFVSSSSNPFTPCETYGIHEELPGIASPAIPLTLFHDLPVLHISSSIVLGTFV